MLKKLRIKFILINMVLATVMLILILGSVYIFTGRNLEGDSLQMMKSIALNPRHNGPPQEEAEEVNLPYFKIMVNASGEADRIESGFFDLSDPDLVDELVGKAMDEETDFGRVEGYDLRFYKVKIPMGQCLVFADTSNERATLYSLTGNLLLIGLGAFILFLMISIFLAGWAVKPVEMAWKQQKQFVADASHELKTPLTVILTDAELMQDPACTGEEREQLTDGIHAMAEQMRGLVESLLELARIDNASVREVKKELRLDEMISEAAMFFEPVFFEKDLILTYEIEAGISLTGIEGHLKQLTDILLDNAAKYSAPGGHTRLSLQRISPRRCLLTVANEGEPIREEDLEHLFTRFYRADKARTACKSYGLGLSIAESIVREHGGRIWAQSRDGINSFFAELPILGIEKHKNT